MKMIQLPGSQALGINAFEMQTVPVTQGLFKQAMGCNPSYSREELNSGLDLPVEQVSWFDAVEFCNRASKMQNLGPCYEVSGDGTQVRWDQAANGFRLPTEAEWEYACRAGSGVDPTDQEILEQAWCCENSGGRTHPVGIRQPNAWGLYDMLGNIWEWCWDLWEPNYSLRVYRGGSWSSPAGYLRAADRSRSAPGYRGNSLGIRCARSTTL